MNPVRRLGTLATEYFLDNPYFTKRLRSHMRGFRFYLMMTGYILLIGVLLCFIYVSFILPQHQMVQNAEAARTLFISIMVAQTLLLCLGGTVLTAASVVTEKEKQTFEMLKLGTRAPGVLVIGEVLAAVTYQGLLVLASLPLTGVVFFLGGVSPGELATLYAAVLLTAVILSVFGVTVSCFQEKLNNAVGTAIGGVFLFSIILQILMQESSTALLACLSPAVLFWNVIPGGGCEVRFFGQVLPLFPCVLAVGSLFFLLLATLASRKVFTPEARAFSTWQIVAVMYGVLFLLMAGAWGSSPPGHLRLLLAWLGLMIVFIFNQLVHVQDRPNKAEKLRPDRWNLFLFHLVLGNALIAIWMYGQGVDFDEMAVPLSASVITVVLCSYRAIVGWLGYFGKNRGAAIRNGLVLIILLLAIPPMMGGIGLQFGLRSHWANQSPHEDLWYALIAVNPLTALLELQSHFSYFSAPGNWDSYRAYGAPWKLCCLFHGLLFLFFLTLQQGRRKQKTEAEKNVEQRRGDERVPSPLEGEG